MATHIMSDDRRVYPGAVFGMRHSTVNNSAGKYVRAGFYYTNTVEGLFLDSKRGLTGVYHHVSEQHLELYLCEFDFRYNERAVSDFERTASLLEGIKGKRITYRGTGILA